MRGKWERKSDALWTYHLRGTTRPYRYVVQDKDAGRPNADWDATVTAARLNDDMTVAERVSFDEARSALERFRWVLLRCLKVIRLGRSIASVLPLL